MRHFKIRRLSGKMSISARNDFLRSSLPANLPQPHRLNLSDGICSIPEDRLDSVLEAVGDFNDFEHGDDPYCKNDFGRLQVGEYHVVWWFSYFDKEWKGHQVDGNRILHIQLAEEFELS